MCWNCNEHRVFLIKPCRLATRTTSQRYEACPYREYRLQTTAPEEGFAFCLTCGAPWKPHDESDAKSELEDLSSLTEWSDGDEAWNIAEFEDEEKEPDAGRYEQNIAEIKPQQVRVVGPHWVMLGTQRRHGHQEENNARRDSQNVAENGPQDVRDPGPHWVPLGTQRRRDRQESAAERLDRADDDADVDGDVWEEWDEFEPLNEEEIANLPHSVPDLIDFVWEIGRRLDLCHILIAESVVLVGVYFAVWAFLAFWR